MLLVGVIYRKEKMLSIIWDCVEYVCEHCFYCTNCWECMVTKKLQKEASEKNLKNSDKMWWSVKFIPGKDPFPYLVSH